MGNLVGYAGWGWPVLQSVSLLIAACFKSKSSLVALNLSVRPSGQEANRHARHASTQAPNQRVSKLWNAALDWERKALRFLLHDQHRIDEASFGQGVRNLLPELARRFVSGHDMRVSSEGSMPAGWHPSRL
jgi:hypothetical protein